MIARVQDFLPQIEAANAALCQREKQCPGSIDLENVEKDEEQYIELVRLTRLRSILTFICGTESRSRRI